MFDMHQLPSNLRDLSVAGGATSDVTVTAIATTNVGTSAASLIMASANTGGGLPTLASFSVVPSCITSSTSSIASLLNYMTVAAGGGGCCSSLLPTGAADSLENGSGGGDQTPKNLTPVASTDAGKIGGDSLSSIAATGAPHPLSMHNIPPFFSPEMYYASSSSSHQHQQNQLIAAATFNSLLQQGNQQQQAAQTGQTMSSLTVPPPPPPPLAFNNLIGHLPGQDYSAFLLAAAAAAAANATGPHALQSALAPIAAPLPPPPPYTNLSQQTGLVNTSDTQFVSTPLKRGLEDASTSSAIFYNGASAAALAAAAAAAAAANSLPVNHSSAAAAALASPMEVMDLNNLHETKKVKLDVMPDYPESKVLHIRNIFCEAQETDLTLLAIPFGSILNMVYAKKTNQALIEMESIEAATQMLNYYNEFPITYFDRTIIFQYSKHTFLSPKITNLTINNAVKMANQMVEHFREKQMTWNQEKSQLGQTISEHNVLRVVIENLNSFTINHLILYKIFEKFGKVLRVIIFSKNLQCQALVEFQRQREAFVALLQLQSQNIYAGSCTLRIEFSKNCGPLHIDRQNDKCRDYVLSPLTDPERVLLAALSTAPPPPHLSSPSVINPALAAVVAAQQQVHQHSQHQHQHHQQQQQQLMAVAAAANLNPFAVSQQHHSQSQQSQPQNQQNQQQPNSNQSSQLMISSPFSPNYYFYNNSLTNSSGAIAASAPGSAGIASLEAGTPLEYDVFGNGHFFYDPNSIISKRPQFINSVNNIAPFQSSFKFGNDTDDSLHATEAGKSEILINQNGSPSRSSIINSRLPIKCKEEKNQSIVNNETEKDSDTVLVFQTLTQKILTPENIATLFDLYGNVVRVNHLNLTSHQAFLIQLESQHQCDIAIEKLNHEILWGSQIQLSKLNHYLNKMCSSRTNDEEAQMNQANCDTSSQSSDFVRDSKNLFDTSNTTNYLAHDLVSSLKSNELNNFSKENSDIEKNQQNDKNTEFSLNAIKKKEFMRLFLESENTIKFKNNQLGNSNKFTENFEELSSELTESQNQTNSVNQKKESSSNDCETYAAICQNKLLGKYNSANLQIEKKLVDTEEKDITQILSNDKFIPPTRHLMIENIPTWMINSSSSTTEISDKLQKITNQPISSISLNLPKYFNQSNKFSCVIATFMSKDLSSSALLEMQHRSTNDLKTPLKIRFSEDSELEMAKSYA